MKELTIDDLFKGHMELYILPWVTANLPKIIGTAILSVAFVMILILAFHKAAYANDAMISTADVATRIENKENMLLIDVRKKKVFIKGHITDAMNIPLQDLAKRLEGMDDEQMEKFAGTPIIVHCRTQNKAKLAFDIFMQNGFIDVEIMKGGYTQWVKEHRKVTKGE